MNVVIYRALLKQTRKGGHMNSPNLLALSDCVCSVNASFVFFLFHLPWDYCIYGPAHARVLKFDPSNRLHPNCMRAVKGLASLCRLTKTIQCVPR